MGCNFLSVLIRTHKRPRTLRRCLGSLDEQTERDFVVILISDYKEDHVEEIISEYPNLKFNLKHVEPLGFPACNTYFNKVRDIVDSDYVVFIDDDDRVIDKTYFKTLKGIVLKGIKPLVIISKAILPRGKIIPGSGSWGKHPSIGDISTQNFCVRSDIYKRCNWPSVRCGDFYFIDTVFKCIDKKDVYWYDKVTMSATNTGSGRPEN